MKIGLVFFLTVLLLLKFKNTNSHKCGTDALEKSQRVLLKQSNGTQNTWAPLRIHLDFSLLDAKIDQFSLDHVKFLKEQVMPRTVEIFKSLLTVRPIVGNLTLTNNLCGKIKTIPDQYVTKGGVAADLILFVLMDETGSYVKKNIEASAMHCFQDDNTSRPIAGYITFKPIFYINNKTALDYMTWLAVHEITHVLALNDGLYEDWIDKDLKPLGKKNVILKIPVWNNKKNMTLLKTPEVIKQGRKHFKCSNFQGLPLENKGDEGTAGSHWMKKFMNTDIMTGDNNEENFISKMTMAMFIDSGWYKADYSLANNFVWGSGQGCDFLNRNMKCIKTDKLTGKVSTKFKNSYCVNLDKPVCSNSHIFRGNCKTNTFKTELKDFVKYFNDGFRGGVSKMMDYCTIPVEDRKATDVQGSSCRDGQNQNINKFEQVCPNCACFLSNLKEIVPVKSFLETKSKVNRDKFLKMKKKQLLPKGKISEDQDLRAMCFEFKCMDGEIYVKFLDRELKKCSDESSISFDGYTGNIQCPHKKVLCDEKYFWKFGGAIKKP
jgi:hypothetical protein